MLTAECFKHSANSIVLIVQFYSQFARAQTKTISTANKKIAQIYLRYLHVFPPRCCKATAAGRRPAKDGGADGGAPVEDESASFNSFLRTTGHLEIQPLMFLGKVL